MGCSGAVPSEHSSGAKTRRGGITKTGNSHLRRIVGEAAWTYRHRPSIGPRHRRRQDGLSEEVRAITWKAQDRSNSRYRRLPLDSNSKTWRPRAPMFELAAFRAPSRDVV